MPNNKSIANNNSGLIQGRCPINQSEDLNQAIDKDNLIDTAKTFIEYAGFDFDKNPISETCRLLSLKDMVVSDAIERYHGSKDAADITEKVFDDYLANEISKRERKLFEKKFANKKSVSTVKKYDSKRDIFVIDNEEHQEPLERTCENENVTSAVKKLAAERLERFKFQANEDPKDAYERLKYIESQVKDDVTSIYGKNYELLDVVTNVFEEYYEVHRYNFVTGNKEPQEITDPVCASEDTDEKEEAMELSCSTEDTDVKPEEAPKVESTTVPAESLDKEDGKVRHVVITDEEKVAVANKIANDCVGKINFSHDEGEAVELLRMFEAEREATSKVVEVYGEDKVALDALRDVFNCLYGNIKTFYEGEPKEEALVEKDVITETPTKDKYDLSPEDAEKVNQSIERIKTKAGIDTETSESLTKDKIKQLVRSKTEEVFGIGNEDAINAVWSIFDRNPYCPIREEDLEIFIKRAILCYIAKEAVDYSGLRLSENKSDEQTCLSEVRKEAINKVKEIYGDDKELLDYVANEVELYATAIAATLQLPNMEKKKQSRPMPIITKPIGRRIPGMPHIVQQRPLSTTENMDNILLSKEEQKQLKAAESDALNRDSMVDYSDPSGKEIENLITKIYGERSRKNLPKESQEQSEQKDEPVFFGNTMSVGLARRIWKKQPCDGSGANLVEPLLNVFFPDKEYQRQYKYGAVVIDELPLYGSESCWGCEDNKELNCFYSVIKYYNNWIDNYYGKDVKRNESGLKFSIHRVHPEPDKYDYVVIENSHSTRPLSFPTKDMADNFLIVFRDLIEESGNLI